MNKTIEIQNITYPIIGYVKIDYCGDIKPTSHQDSKALPVADIPLMSDYRWQEMCLEDRVNNPEKYPDKEKLARDIEKLTSWLEEHKKENKVL